MLVALAQGRSYTETTRTSLPPAVRSGRLLKISPCTRTTTKGPPVSNGNSAPDATVYRLSLYHCYLGELLRADPDARLTSGSMAAKLDIKDETVRRDISFIGQVGRPGAGYGARELFDAIQQFLGLKEEYPVIRIGSAEMLKALQVVFPASSYGVRPVAYFSERPEDVGTTIDNIPIKSVTDIPELDPSLEVTVGLVACAPAWVQVVIDQCAKAGLKGILLLTPALSVDRPEGVAVTQIRMPCDIKSLACRCKVPLYADDE